MKKKYCFVCFHDASKSTSGLACRMSVLAANLTEKGNIFLIINRSLYEKTLLDRSFSKSIFIIPEIFGFKISVLLLFPLLLIYMMVVGVRTFHVSAGAASLLGIFKFAGKIVNIKIHSSIGSRTVLMATGGLNKYIKIHENILKTVSKLDCLYPSSGFPGYEYKITTAPCSFSWKYSIQELNHLAKTEFKKEKLIVFSGSLTAEKNYDLVFRAVELFVVQAGSPRISLEMFCTGLSSLILARVKEINRIAGYDVIKFKNYSMLEASLSRAYLFVSVQKTDNYPSQSLIEAMVHGCSIVATDVGDTRKMIKVENGNYLVSEAAEDICNAFTMAFSNIKGSNSINQRYVIDNHSVVKYANYFYDEFVLS